MGLVLLSTKVSILYTFSMIHTTQQEAVSYYDPHRTSAGTGSDASAIYIQSK